jgi:hypothetical protein
MDSLEPYVEYHGFVLLKNATDSHSTGLKSQFRLRNDDDLDVFKSITKRRKGHAGQIYRMHFRPIEEEDFRVADIFFLGATWSHTNGTVVAFEFTGKEDWQQFREWPALSEGKQVEAKEIEILLFRVGENGELVNLAQRDRIEKIEQMKGGPQSIRCAKLLLDGEFMDYVCSLSVLETVSEETAEAWIKKTIGISSRKELDNDESALNRFNKLVMSPFNRWRA